MSDTAIVIIVISLTFLLFVAGASWFFFVYIPRQIALTANEAAKTIRQVFGFTPEIRINQRVVYKQTREILELATLEQEFDVEYELKHTRLGSEKYVIFRGTYLAKIGFDLTKGFQIEVQRGRFFRPTQITTILPHAEILSIEEVDVQKFEKSGWINWVSINDRKQASEQLTLLAKDDASKLEILSNAENEIANRLTEVLLPKLSDFSPNYEIQFIETDANYLMQPEENGLSPEED